MFEAQPVSFRLSGGQAVPAVTSGQMREIDRIAVEEFGLGILQMMENAGRSLAGNVIEMLGGDRAEVTVLAGPGGNGGGGLCCARHMHNRGFRVWVVLSKPLEELGDAAGNQLRILQRAGVEPVAPEHEVNAVRSSRLVVDALIGYGLEGAPRGRAAELIALCNEEAARVLSLDLPSGLDATTGRRPGAVVRAERTMTLALPKTGMRDLPGEVFLADIGIPPEAYARLSLSFDWPVPARPWVPLVV